MLCTVTNLHCILWYDAEGMAVSPADVILEQLAVPGAAGLEVLAAGAGLAPALGAQWQWMVLQHGCCSPCAGSHPRLQLAQSWGGAPRVI